MSNGNTHQNERGNQHHYGQTVGQQQFTDSIKSTAKAIGKVEGRLDEISKEQVRQGITLVEIQTDISYTKGAMKARREIKSPLLGWLFDLLSRYFTRILVAAMISSTSIGLTLAFGRVF